MYQRNDVRGTMTFRETTILQTFQLNYLQRDVHIG
jgi:hypothetical protein